MGLLSLIVKMGINKSGFDAGVDAAGKKVARFGSDMRNHLARAFGVAAVGAFIKSTIELGSRINDMSQQMGISTDAVQVFSLAARLGGSNLDAFGARFAKLQKSLGDATEKNTAGPFAAFGLSIKNLRSMSPDEIFERIANQMDKAAASGAEMSALFDIFGKGATSLIPVFRELATAREKAFLMSPTDIKKMDEMGDIWEQIKVGAMTGAADVIASPTKGLFDQWIKLAAYNPLMKPLVGKTARKRVEKEEETSNTEALRLRDETQRLKVLEEENRLKEEGLNLDEQIATLAEKFRASSLTAEEKLLEAKAKQKRLSEELFMLDPNDNATKRKQLALAAQDLVVQALTPKEKPDTVGAMDGMKLGRAASNSLGAIGAYSGGGANRTQSELEKLNRSMDRAMRVLSMGVPIKEAQ